MHAQPVTALAFSSDSPYLFSASHSGQVKIWDLLLSKDIYTFYYGQKEINALMFLSQRDLLLSSGASREISGYFLEKKTIFLGFSPPLTSQAHTGAVLTLTGAPCGQWIAGAGTQVCLG